MLNALIKSARERTDADSESLEASLEICGPLRKETCPCLSLNQQHQFQPGPFIGTFDRSICQRNTLGDKLQYGICIQRGRSVTSNMLMGMDPS